MDCHASLKLTPNDAMADALILRSCEELAKQYETTHNPKPRKNTKIYPNTRLKIASTFFV